MYHKNLQNVYPRSRVDCPFLYLGSMKRGQPRRSVTGEKGHDLMDRVGKPSKAMASVQYSFLLATVHDLF